MKFKINLFLYETFFFLAAQLLGVWVAFRLLPSLQAGVGRKTDLTTNDLLFFGIGFLIVIMVIVLFGRTKIFYRLFLLTIIFLGAQTVFSSFLGFSSSFILSAATVLLTVTAKRIIVQNLAVVLAIAGIGSILGLSFTPFTIVVILIVFSFYDIIAVYKTKHMIRMAEDMVKSRAIFGIIIPSRLSLLFRDVRKVKLRGEFMILGSGDILMPLLLSASLVTISLTASLIVVLFSLVGLFVTSFLFSIQKKRRPMAALPPIATLSIIGYLVSIFLI